MKRPLLIFAGSLILAYGVATEREKNLEEAYRFESFQIATVPKYDLVIPTNHQTIPFNELHGGELLIKPTYHKNIPGIGEHTPMHPELQKQLTKCFYFWFIGTFFVSAFLLNYFSKEHDHE